MHSSIVENWSRSEPVSPWVTLGVIGVCLLLTLTVSLLPDGQRQSLISTLGFIPANIYVLLQQAWINWFSQGALSLATSLFTHASWAHLLGNLAFLLIFGVSVERRLGHWVFLALFILGGALTNAIIAIELQDMQTPIIGASGSVSIVIGVYLGLFPRGRIGLYLPLGLYLQFARLPAVLVIGSWFTLQLLYTVFGPINSKVAWWTHITGFVVGLLVAILVHLVNLITKAR